MDRHQAPPPTRARLLIIVLAGAMLSSMLGGCTLITTLAHAGRTDDRERPASTPAADAAVQPAPPVGAPAGAVAGAPPPGTCLTGDTAARIADLTTSVPCTNDHSFIVIGAFVLDPALVPQGATPDELERLRSEFANPRSSTYRSAFDRGTPCPLLFSSAVGLASLPMGRLGPATLGPKTGADLEAIPGGQFELGTTPTAPAEWRAGRLGMVCSIAWTMDFLDPPPDVVKHTLPEGFALSFWFVRGSMSEASRRCFVVTDRGRSSAACHTPHDGESLVRFDARGLFDATTIERTRATMAAGQDPESAVLDATLQACLPLSVYAIGSASNPSLALVVQFEDRWSDASAVPYVGCTVSAATPGARLVGSAVGMVDAPVPTG